MWISYSVFSKQIKNSLKEFTFSVAYLPKIFCFGLALLLFASNINSAQEKLQRKWVGTWSTAPQLVEVGNNPPSPGLSNNTIRQVIHVSIGGDSLRLRITNEFSSNPIKINSVHIANSKGNGIIDSITDKTIYFAGSEETTIGRASAIMSDPFSFKLAPLSDVAITISYGETSSDISGHPGSRTTSYILTGNQVKKVDFSSAVKTDHWYNINTLEVLAPQSTYVVAILGNSITDGRGSGTNKQNRWPDELAGRLQANEKTKHVAVLNEGIGGNCVLKACLGPSAINRFERDVLNQNGVKWLIIFEGINDIGGAFGAQGSAKVAQDLITAYIQMIDKAHAKGILVYGATLLPFGGSSYDSQDHQTAWKTVNDWIRTSGKFDAVIDLDSVIHDPSNTSKMLPTADTGDHLHPNEAGHKMMADAVDLSLFVSENGTSIHNIEKLPEKFSLLQNYPNPFNPNTKIHYSIKRESLVQINIHNLLGEKVASIVNKFHVPGNYLETWDASKFPAGVYYCSMQAEFFHQTKKMILLK